MKSWYSRIGLALVIAVAQATVQAQPPAPEVRDDAHTLVFNHAAVQRVVEVIPKGVRTVTTMTDPELTPVLRRHVRDMTRHLENGGRVRAWDPLFAELAAVQQQINLEWNDIEGGIEVLSTSENPEVVKLIQAHAAKVSAMAEQGPAAMRQATPLPADYQRPADVAPVTAGQGCGRGPGAGAAQGCGAGRGPGAGAGQGCGAGAGACADAGAGPSDGAGQGRGPGRGQRGGWGARHGASGERGAP